MLESRTLLATTDFNKRPSCRIAWLLLASALVALVICVTAMLYEQTSLRKTIRAIERVGGEVTCRFACDSRLAFLQPLLSPLFGDVVEVSLAYTNVTESELASLEVFPKLWSLDLSGTKITDSGLQHLYGLNALEYVDLVNVEGVSQIGIDDLQKAKPRCWIYCGEPDPGPPGR